MLPVVQHSIGREYTTTAVRCPIQCKTQENVSHPDRSITASSVWMQGASFERVSWVGNIYLHS